MIGVYLMTHTIRKRRSKQSFERKRTLFWMGIIAVITFVLSALLFGASSLLTKSLNLKDTIFSPMNLDKATMDKMIDEYKKMKKKQ